MATRGACPCTAENKCFELLKHYLQVEVRINRARLQCLFRSTRHILCKGITRSRRAGRRWWHLEKASPLVRIALKMQVSRNGVLHHLSSHYISMRTALKPVATAAAERRNLARRYSVRIISAA